MVKEGQNIACISPAIILDRATLIYEHKALWSWETENRIVKEDTSRNCSKTKVSLRII